MYMLNKLEEKEESKVKFDLKYKNILTHYYIDAVDGKAYFLGGQSYLDKDGINIKRASGSSTLGIKFYQPEGGSVGDIRINTNDDLVISAVFDLILASSDILQLWGQDGINLNDDAFATKLNVSTRLQIPVGANMYG